MISIKTAAFVLTLIVVTLQGGTGYKIETRYPVPGDGGFDYLTIDSQARRIYISHGTQVDVVDADNGKVIGTIGDTPGVHGIAIASEFKQGFTSNGRENKVSIFDSVSLKLIKKIDVGKGPDGIYYDPRTKRVFTNNHGSHDISAIDAKTGEVVGTVKAEGDGEQAVIGADGMIYVNSENTAEVVVFDPKSLEIKHRFPIGVAKTPTGLAYDAKTNRLFIGCREEPKMVVMDASNGKVITSFPIAKGVDFAGFDSQAKLAFFSCGEGVLNIFHEKSADVIEDAGAVKTQSSAKTMAFDEKTKKVYLTAAEYVETPAADPSQRPRRTVKPGSFTVLVVSK
jgi:DNA-binding beta-propeller fold protein YncE